MGKITIVEPENSIRNRIKAIQKEISEIQSRELSDEEIVQLVSNNNRTIDPTWKNIRVIISKDEESFDCKHIFDCHFLERCFIGNFEGIVTFDSSLSLPCGLFNTIIKNSIIFSGSAVMKASLLQDTIVCSGSIILGSGRIWCKPNSTFGNGTVVNLGNETGGREVKICSDMYYSYCSGIFDRDNISAINAYSEEYARDVMGDMNIIDSHSLVESGSAICSVYIGQHARITGSYLCNASVLSESSNRSIVNSSSLIDAIIQWAVRCDTGASVEMSLMFEHTEVTNNAKMVNSIIAPNTAVSSGECNSCLVGPFIGFHHNSVLISALWYSGKGNIGYGANIGSNHTGRLPDQECFPGEGVFFGLGCSIKYPFNMCNSMYSIVATGVTCLPQRIEMPFSLINNPLQSFPSVSPAYNEIFPGWVLSDNYYMIVRNEEKFANRNKSTRNTFETGVLRSDIVCAMMKAREYLSFSFANRKNVYLDYDVLDNLVDRRSGEAVGDSTTPSELVYESSTCAFLSPIQDIGGANERVLLEDKDVYTDYDIIAIGKNLMTNASRKKAIDVYTKFIRVFAMRGVKNAVLWAFGTSTDLDVCRIKEYPEWRIVYKLVMSELTDCGIRGIVNALYSIEFELLESAEKSKNKDYVRGRRVDDHYDQSHNYDRDMSVLRKVKARLEAEQVRVNELIDRVIASSAESSPIADICGETEWFFKNQSAIQNGEIYVNALSPPASHIRAHSHVHQV